MKVIRDIYIKLLKELSKPQVSILLGPRQVGKTFLLKELENEAKKNKLRIQTYNLEIPTDIIQFNKSDADLFKNLTTDTDILFIDEFHYLKNASQLFKSIYDSNYRIKIVASGSSSIEIHKHLKESMAGRRIITRMFPLNYNEILQTTSKNIFEEFLIYGGMPGLIHCLTSDEKIELLQGILETYILKDIKSLVKEENIRAFNSLLYLIAENQGSISIISNLAKEIGLTSKTINHYLTLLEQTYVVLPLHSYAKNLGNELKKSKKYYFYDIGIRNMLIKDFSLLTDREDHGILNESFIFLQLLNKLKPNMEIRFWRNKQGDEIDFVLIKNRKPFLIEVKSSLNKMTIPKAFYIFLNNYPECTGGIIFSDNLTGKIEYKGKIIKFMKNENIFDFINKFY